MSLPMVPRRPIERARIDAEVAAWRARIEKQTLTKLTLMQTIALLKMNKSTLSRGVAQRLIDGEACQDHPCYGDYLALAELGFCERPSGSQWHQLTLLGTSRAEAVTRDECKRIGIHVMAGGAMVGKGDCRFTCTCGGWDWRGRAGNSTERNASNSFGKHLATVDGMRGLAAALKPPVKAEGV